MRLDRVRYVRAAMLFAWADNMTAQEKIIKLKTEEEIERFFNSQRDIIFVIDQMNALNDSTKDVKEWLHRIAFNHPKVFSSSANDMDFFRQLNKQNPYRMLHVYGGLTKVSHLKISVMKIYVTMRLLTRLGGNGAVVEAT